VYSVNDYVKKAHTITAVLAFGACSTFGQPQPAKPQFEVASIKPADPSQRGMRIQLAPGGRYTAAGVTVRFLIQQAYGVRDFQISGAPGWVGLDRFEINAKADAETAAIVDKDSSDSDLLIETMIQGLLEDRFHLKINRETKEMPVYALVLAKGGSKLKENTDGEGPQIMRSRAKITLKRADLPMMAVLLSQILGRTVVDKTGLKGNYDVTLEWTPEDAQSQGSREGGTETAPPADPNGPTIFTALQEQLGLRLESTKGPVQILVIDHVEKPSEN
jgi:bla regulator protein blaR1